MYFRQIHQGHAFQYLFSIYWKKVNLYFQIVFGKSLCLIIFIYEFHLCNFSRVCNILRFKIIKFKFHIFMFLQLNLSWRRKCYVLFQNVLLKKYFLNTTKIRKQSIFKIILKKCMPLYLMIFMKTFSNPLFIKA